MRLSNNEWGIYEMLKGNRKLDFEFLLKKARKKDLVNAIIWYVSRKVEYNMRTEDEKEDKNTL